MMVERLAADQPSVDSFRAKRPAPSAQMPEEHLVQLKMMHTSAISCQQN
jgi:hypothetical protein